MVQSVAQNHFPCIVWREGKKRLWNPVQRKALKNRPEERVRLRILEYLIEGGWSKHRITTEEAVDLPQNEALQRTDLICYTKEFTPFLLVECKAERIHLSQQTARQIARYNQKIDAPFLMMTNGVYDYWYSLEEGSKAVLLHEIPDVLPAPRVPEQRPFSYWAEHGFAGDKAAPSLRTWLHEALYVFGKHGQDSTLRFLSFNRAASDIDLQHYYQVESIEGQRIAMSFIATAYGDTRLIAIANDGARNTGLLEINLDLLFDERTPNASISTEVGTRNLDIRSHLNDALFPSFSLQKAVAQIHVLFSSFAA